MSDDFLPFCELLCLGIRASLLHLQVLKIVSLSNWLGVCHYRSQPGTLWYLRIILSTITKNGICFVPRMEMPIPKMAMVTSKLLYFQVERINSDY